LYHYFGITLPFSNGGNSWVQVANRLAELTTKSPSKGLPHLSSTWIGEGIGATFFA